MPSKLVKHNYLTVQCLFYERRTFSLLCWLLSGVPRCMGRSDGKRNDPCEFQTPCSPCPGLRVSRAGVEANTAVKDAGKAERKAITEKKTMTGKEKKPSIHERLEINKRIIQEKQGKDKPERGADLSVRTV